VVTFEQAVCLALEMARDQQRPYYVIERATVTPSMRRRSGRVVRKPWIVLVS
jgi:hypothetical protein